MSKHEEKFALLCKAAHLPEPEREYRFARAIKRQWRFDFCWPDAMVAVEVEGGVWSRGRHTRGVGYIKDCEKYSTAAEMGWIVYRLTPEMIDLDWLDRIATSVQARQRDSQTA